MKNKFIFVVAAIMAVMFSMTAFAAKGWVPEENGWKYYDNDGIAVTCEWKKDGANWFYLGTEGTMVTSSLIDTDDNAFYYVDENGARVSGAWVLINDAERDITDKWMYFKKDNGKSVTSGWYTIANKKYCFEDNKMLTGYITESLSTTENYAEAMYMCDESGARVSGWKEAVDSDGNNIWLYFKSGKKAVDTSILINGHKYAFDSDGKMLTGIVATSSQYYYFNTDPTRAGYPEGALVKLAWTERTNSADGTNYWIYSKANGELATNGQYKVGSKYYFFDSEGVMLTGWNDGKYYRADGDMATGSVKIANSHGEEETYMFKKDGSPAEDGYNGKAYENGKLIVPSDDHRYMIYNGKLINRSGSYQKKGSYKDSAYDVTYVVDDNGLVVNVK